MISSLQKKVAILGLIIGILGGAFYFAGTGFFASLIDSGASNATGNELYISDNYTALSSDTGFINIKSNIGFTNVAAISFSLKYNPVKIHFAENYQIGTFQQGTNNTFTPGMVVVTPNNTTGVVSIDIADASSFSLGANQDVIRLSIQLQSGLINAEQVSISFSEAQVIDSLFNIKSAKTAAGIITIQANASAPLQVLDAQAISATQISVTFNDFLTSVAGTTATITDLVPPVPAIAFTASLPTIDPNNGQKMLLTVTPALTAGQNYKLVLAGGPSGNINTVLDVNNATTYFAVAAVTPGTNALTAASALTSTSIQLTFTAPVTETNPVKYALFNSLGVQQVIAKVVLQNNLAILTPQAALIPGAKYYVLANGVPAMSTNKIQYFYFQPLGVTTVQSFQPSSLGVAGGTVVVSGENLDQVVKASIGNVVLAISNQTAGSFTLTIPQGLEAKSQDIRFEMKNGTILVKTNAISITATQAGIQIISSESYASPQRVPNDGKTKTTLWALIDYQQGVGDINKVTLDLRPINGAAVVPMVGVDANGQMKIVNNRRWFWLDTYVPNTVTTSETPQNLTITVEDPRGNKATGTISLIVTKNVLQSQAPTILDAYGVPTQLKPGEVMGFYANIQDFDGIKDIDKVVVNLGPLGLAPRTMVSADLAVANATSTPAVSSTNNNITSSSNTVSSSTSSTTANTDIVPDERVSMWYGVQNILIPANTTPGQYNVQVTASNKTGATNTRIISLTITNGNGPVIDEDRTQVSPRLQIQKDGKEPFSVTTYVSDQDGINDITSVTIDLQEVGGTMVKMDLQGTAQEGQKGGWFIAKDLSVAKGVFTGYKTLKIYANDKQGNEASRDVDIEIAQQDIGSAPSVNFERSYTTPATVPADGKTKVAFNVFIQANDFTITQVMADLSNIAEYVGQQTASSADSANSCLGATSHLVCLKSGLQEGGRGQWYTLNDIIIPKSTPSSMQPYRIRIVAVDEKGNTSDGYIALNVGDGTLSLGHIGFPKVQMAISTSPATLEIQLSNPVDPKKLKLGAFKITDRSNTTDTLAVTAAVINSSATVITLTTNDQEAGKIYTLFADAKILGLKEDQYTDNHADFEGFNKQAIPLQITKITPLSPTLLEVVFSEGIRPSSVSSDGTDFQIYTNEQQPQRKNVLHTEFKGDNQTLRISTETLGSAQKYTLRVKNIYSAAGIQVGGNQRTLQSGIKKEYFGIVKNFIAFKGIVPSSVQALAEAADFDKNGIVDFTDFTVFSSVYGQKLQNASISDQTNIEKSDLDHNGVVDFTDFTIFSAAYEKNSQNPTITVPVPVVTSSTAGVTAANPSTSTTSSVDTSDATNTK